MDYFVYENWTHKRSRVHRGSCVFCNSGKGNQASHSGRNDQWHGPFLDQSAALKKARSFGWDNSASCSVCM